MIGQEVYLKIADKLRNNEQSYALGAHLVRRAFAGPEMSTWERMIWSYVAENAHGGRIIMDDPNDPYLLRMYMTPHEPEAIGKTVTRTNPDVFAHYFFRGDTDRELHNHPWKKSYSFILTAGYLEERLVRGAGPFYPEDVRRKFRNPFTLASISHDTFHRVHLVNGPCWTIFYAGERMPGVERGKDWGFLDETGDFEAWGDREARVKNGAPLH